MSKFFDQTRKAEDLALREGAAKNFNVERALESIFKSRIRVVVLFEREFFRHRSNLSWLARWCS